MEAINIARLYSGPPLVKTCSINLIKLSTVYAACGCGACGNFTDLYAYVQNQSQARRFNGEVPGKKLDGLTGMGISEVNPKPDLRSVDSRGACQPAGAVVILLVAE
jgi:coproporphyrinogen III oxidase-like Fe-S oxidoreductase